VLSVDTGVEPVFMPCVFDLNVFHRSLMLRRFLRLCFKFSKLLAFYWFNGITGILIFLQNSITILFSAVLSRNKHPVF